MFVFYLPFSCMNAMPFLGFLLNRLIPSSRISFFFFFASKSASVLASASASPSLFKSWVLLASTGFRLEDAVRKQREYIRTRPPFLIYTA